MFGLRGYATNRIIDICMWMFVCNSNNTKNFQHTYTNTKPECCINVLVGLGGGSDGGDDVVLHLHQLLLIANAWARWSFALDLPFSYKQQTV